MTDQGGALRATGRRQARRAYNGVGGGARCGDGQYRDGTPMSGLTNPNLGQMTGTDGSSPSFFHRILGLRLGAAAGSRASSDQTEPLD